jgi:hypothetical protein
MGKEMKKVEIKLTVTKQYIIHETKGGGTVILNVKYIAMYIYII